MITVILEFVIINVLLSSTLAFTSQSTKLLRTALIAICGGFLVLIQLELNRCYRNRFPAAAMLSVHWLLLLRVIGILLLAPISPASTADSQKVKRADQDPPTTTSIFSRLATNQFNLWSFRTYPKPIRYIPPFSRTNPDYIPSRTTFLVTSALHLAVAVLLILLADLTFPAPTEVTRLFSPRQEQTLSRLSELTIEECITKLFTVTGAGVGVWANFHLVYDTLAIASVAFGATEPKDWPPLFGDLRDAYTLRRFWGLSWHQTLRQPLDNTGVFVASRILRLSRNSAAFLVVRFGVAFMLSGAAHYIGDIARSTPYPLHSGASITFFFMQFVGVVIEQVVQNIWQRRYAPAAWHKSIGYIWVGSFLFWTCTSVALPTVRSRRWDVDYNLPISMF